MCGCIHQPKLCQNCAERPTIKKVVEKFAEPLAELLDKRAKALASHSKTKL